VKSYLATYHFHAAEPAEATVLLFDKEIHIGYHDQQQQHQTVQWKMEDVEAMFDLSTQATRIRHRQTPGLDFYIRGNDALQYIQTQQAEQQKPWHKKDKAKDWGRNLLIFFGVVTALVLLYFLLVPWLSEKLAGNVSVQTEEQFGEAVYGAMNFEGSEDTAASFAVNHFFDELKITTPYTIRIAVIRGETVNAFALPGGRIVVYTALLKKMETYPELAALLAHEFTHVNNKHSTKSIFRRLGSKIFLGLLFGKFGSVTSVMVDQADNLKSLTYSRRLEKEADLEGLALLKERKIESNGFTDLFHHLKESGPGSSMPEFLASHPDIDNRITYIKEEAAGYTAIENSSLKSIFEKIKQSIQ
jgi:hypothetical protein